MFDVGFPELVLVAVIGLLVLGPQRLPKVAAEIGKWVGRARRTASQLRRQLEREIELEDLERLRTRSAPPPGAAPTPPGPAPTPPGTESSPSPPPGAEEASAPSPAVEPASPGTSDKPPQS